MSDKDKSAILTHVLDILSKAATRRSGVDISVLLRQSLGKALANDVRKGTGETDPSAYDHIADWLAASVANDLPWLRNVDERGVPRKFQKIGGVESLVEEANRGLERMRHGAPRAYVDFGDVEVVADLADGFKVVRLKSAGALDEESDEMQHCVGQGGYDIGIASGSVEILSLRDANGRPHVTMEVQDGCVTQIKGKQNAFPISRYFAVLVPWIEGMGLAIAENELAGGYFAHGGRIRHVSDIAAGERFEGNLILRVDATEGNGLALPDGLAVEKGFVVDVVGGGDAPVTFGRGTHVGGVLLTRHAILRGVENVASEGLHVMSGAVAQVPHGTVFHGQVVISGAAVGDLLSKATFENGLEVAHMAEFAVPRAAAVRGSLKIQNVARISVEDGAVVVGDLSCLRGNEDFAVDIGDDVSIGGNLSVENASVHTGARLTVDGAYRL